MVLSELRSVLNLISSAWYNHPEIVSKIDKLIISIFSSKVKVLGYEYPPSENFLIAQTRTLSINAAATSNDKEVIAELINRFKRFVNGDESSINANIRTIVFKTVLKHTTNPRSDFDAVKNIYLTTDSVDARLAALSSLGAINNLELVKELLDMSLNGDLIKTQDITRPLNSLASDNPMKVVVYELLWTWCVKNWDTLHENLSVALSLLGNVLKICVSSQIGDKFIKVVEDWASGSDCNSPEGVAKRLDQLLSAKRPLEQGLERVKMMTSWVERDTASVNVWSSKIVKPFNQYTFYSSKKKKKKKKNCPAVPCCTLR
jgi:aminopeptidase 2